MTGKKLLTLMIAPVFAFGMAACGNDQADEDVWTEEGQLPAYEDPAYDPTYEMDRDTVIVPETQPQLPEEDVTTDPEPPQQY